MAIVGPTKDHKIIRAWAKRHDAEAVEDLLALADSTPATLRLMLIGAAAKSFMRPIEWEDFFARFDCLGLSFVGKDGCGRSGELIRIDPHSVAKIDA